MFTARRVAVVALPALLVFGLTGCSLLQAKDASDTPTGVAACALGHTWSLDTKDLAAQLLADYKKGTLPVTALTADGSKKLEWGIKGEVKITNDYTVVVTVTPAEGQSTIATQTHKGTVTGKAYIDAEVAIPRDWKDKDFKVSTKFVINGTEKAADAADPFAIAPTDFDDSVGVELTCDGDTMTTHPRGARITETWKRTD